MTHPALHTTTANLYLTARDTGDRLSKRAIASSSEEAFGREVVRVRPDETAQRVLGFGGAFTEAAGVTFSGLSEARQQEFLRAYFDEKAGHGYTLCRTHINSCDFSLGNYAYAETPGDTALADFSIDRDRKYLLPLIQRARRVAPRGFRLFASPWSPPAWMKTNGMMNNGGRLKPEYRRTWAQYYARYIQCYEAEGVGIWGLTVQNEPAATQRWDSCIYSAEEERDFVRDHLGPVLHEAGLGDRKIIIWDHNRDGMAERAAVILGDPAAARYVWGTGFHWYGPDCFDHVQQVHDAFPDKALIFTEGCQEGGPHIGSWDLGERYARSMINDLNRWTVGWVDWNLMLDLTGGPNHVGNLCSAPILADIERDQLLYQSSYFYIGHFSRFIRPGAQRIGIEGVGPGLEATAFMNEDRAIVVVILNAGESNRRVPVCCEGQRFDVELPKRGIATLQFARPA